MPAGQGVGNLMSSAAAALAIEAADGSSCVPGPCDALKGIAGPDDRADAIKELVHELRTPLNAISGFAQLIEAQLRDMPASPHAAGAAAILKEAAKLAALIDELERSAAPPDLPVPGNDLDSEPACQEPPRSVSPSSQVGL